jgi:hypothetical protein
MTASLFYSHQRFGYYRMVRNRLINGVYANLIHGAATQRQVFCSTFLLLPVSPLAGRLRDAEFADIGLIPSHADAPR